MRPHNMKIHLIAIGCITAVILALYMLISPQQVITGPAAKSDRFITIVQATWGKNCDRFIAEGITNWQVPPADAVNPAPRPSYAQFNNALEPLKKACEGQMTCSFAANSTNIGIDPMRDCAKRLNMSYRCYEMDRLWPLEIAQGNTLQIDCREGVDQAAAAAALAK